VRLIATPFDFTFVRSIFAAVYSSQGGHCYDPASLFVLLVFAFVDGHEYLSDFLRDLHHPDKGQQYHKLAGIQDDCIPKEADFTNFQQRCGFLFNAVFYVVKVIDFVLDMTGLQPKLKHDNDRLQLPPERSEREQQRYTKPIGSRVTRRGLLEGGRKRGYPRFFHREMPSKARG
jgi:hypothetical protein